MRFFCSFLGSWGSLVRSFSLEGDFENKLLRSLVGVAEVPDVIVVVTPCSGVRGLSFSVEAGAFSRLGFLTSDSLLSGTVFNAPGVSAMSVEVVVLVGDSWLEELVCWFVWAILDAGDNDRVAGILAPLGARFEEAGVGESAFLKRPEGMPGDLWDGTVLLR